MFQKVLKFIVLGSRSVYEKVSPSDIFNRVIIRTKKLFSTHLLPFQLSIRINELENKRQFKCVWVNAKMKEEKELVLYPNKNGSVDDLLDEARKQVELAEGGSDKLRSVRLSYSYVLRGGVQSFGKIRYL